MYQQQGFTLIELLVVVLIIGILAAVALPQYKKAVYRTCAMEGYLLLQEIEKAQKVCFLEKGEYCHDIDEFYWSSDIKAKGSESYAALWCSGYNCGVRLDDKRCKVYWGFSDLAAHGRLGYEKSCSVYTTDSNVELGRKICEDVGGVYKHEWQSRYVYVLPNR